MIYRKRLRVRASPPLWPVSVLVVLSYLAIYAMVLWGTRIPTSEEASAKLRGEFGHVDRVLVRSGGFAHPSAQGDGFLKVIDNPLEIAELARGIQVTDSGTECLCGGQFSLELVRDGQLSNLISLHHGSHLRLGHNQASFLSGDLYLTPSAILHLYRWFGTHGIRHPSESARWEFAQSAVFAQIIDGHEGLFPPELWPEVLRTFIEDDWKQKVERLLPEPTERAATLLRMLGTFFFSWDLCFDNRTQRLVRDTLPGLSPQQIAAALDHHPNDPLLEAGAAQWFFAYDKLPGREPNLTARLLERLAPAALVHPRPHNRFLTRRTLARVGSPLAKSLLRAVADGKTPVPPPLPCYEAELELCPAEARRHLEDDASLPDREHALKLLE